MRNHLRSKGYDRAWQLIAVVGVGLAAATTPECAAAEDTIWRTVLEQQLVAEKKCELDHFVYVREIEVAGEPRIDGRVRCLDQREFEFTRLKLHQKFEIRSCAPAVC